LTPQGNFVNNDFNTLNDTICIDVISKDTSDIGVSKYYSPLNGLPIKEKTSVNVEVTNYGNLTANSYQVVLKVNNKVKERKTVNIPLKGKESTDVSFTYQLNPDSAVNFEICTSTILFDDVIDANDSNCIVVSTIVGVESEGSNAGLMGVYPNPSTGRINYSVDLESDQEVMIKVYDLSGRLLKSDLIQQVKGPQIIEMNYDDLSDGTYLFNMHIGDKTINGRFVIVK
jgi:hypothetical protein